MHLGIRPMQQSLSNSLPGQLSPLASKSFATAQEAYSVTDLEQLQRPHQTVVVTQTKPKS